MQIRGPLLRVIVLVLLLAPIAAEASEPGPGDPVRVTLVGGTAVDGVLVSIDDEVIVLDMDGQDFTLRRSRVESIEATSADTSERRAQDDELVGEDPSESLDASPGSGPEDVRRRWIRRAGSVGLSPRLSPFGGNQFNEDLTLGLTADIWLAEWIGIEANVSVFPLGDGSNSNAKNLAVAVLRLLDPSFRLEAIERHAAWTVSVALLPVWGHLGPPGAPGLSVDFLLALGAGMEFDAVEMLAHEMTGPGADGTVVTDLAPYTRPVFNLVFGTRLWPTRWLGFRVEGRLMGGPVTVLDFSTDEAAATNRNLGPLANRLTCTDASITEKACTTGWEGSFTVEFAVDFGLGVRRREAP
jgi:hypothetical protein